MASANNNKNLYCPNKPSSSPYVLKVSFSESNINAVNNTTIINATASLSSSSGANWSSSYNSSLSIYWWDEDTRKETYITSINFSSIALSSTKTVSGSITVQHNSNGKKRGAIGVYFTQGSSSGGWCPASTVLWTPTTDLTTISRGSKFGAIIGNEIGSNITFNIIRENTNFTHTFWYRLNNEGAWSSPITGVTDSCTFKVPIEECSKLPNSTSGTLQLCIRTLNGTTQIGSDLYKDITVKVPTSVVPDFKLSVSRLDNGVPTAWNTYVKGFSKATITINDATGGIGSSVKSYSITGGGINTTNASATTEKLNTVGDVVFTAIVTDSRGRSKKKTVTVNVKDYYAPSLNVLNVERCNADGSANTAGTNIKVKVSYGIASVDNKNYIANKSVSCNGVTNTSFENNKEFILQANCSPATQYTVTTIIKDALGKTASVTNQVRTDTRVMNIKKNKKAIAFGGFAGADNTAKSYWDLYATQYFNLDGTKKVLFNDELKWENIIGKPGTFSPKNHSHNYASSIGSMRSETNGIVKFYNDASNANASTNPFATIQREGTYTTFTNNDASTGSRVQLKLGNGRRVYLADSSFTPDSASNGLVNLGGSSGKWNQVWATNGTIQTSDENTKQNIRTPDEIYYKLAENIELVQYQFKETNQDDNIGRTHIGAISQQVEKAMNDLGLTGKDFAGFCKDKKQIVDVDENGVETYEAIDNEFNYALRYGELAMLKIWYLEEKLKKQQIEIDELKEKVEMLMK